MSMRTAARELGLKPRECELAVQLGVVRADPGAGWGPFRVPRAEVERIRGAEGFPAGLMDRLCVVGPVEGARLLGISPARFNRLAKAGCLRPVRFCVNRYRNVVWLYLADDLAEFAERSPELLTGRAPESVRSALAGGADRRPRQWRHRRVEQLLRQAGGVWERAAARAAVLDGAALAAAVPDAGEQDVLRALRPSLADVGAGAQVSTKERVADLCRATEESEVLWYQLMLAADLEAAREAAARVRAARSEPMAEPAGEPSHRPDPAVRASGRRREGWRWRPWPRRVRNLRRPAFGTAPPASPTR
ncbi:DUF6397 family protein [Streptomyces boncukensis]|uniref:Helix-turn-helix domain-containing protein n=1 Tax=Streptomyces boncukensis TaxID=2711219 RepID=A0A6G4WU40_9ACTN|nr:DUF6397 family protein [Streptomyces boncukensis]NGO68799.1 helix-turn-helix domain-containing protein [Streptomyces boncukensis]